MRRIPALMLLTGSLFSAAACVAADDVETLSAVLANGNWTRGGGTPGLLVRSSYHFSKDGTFTYEVRTDLTTHGTGRWEVTKNANGDLRVNLQRKNGTKYEDMAEARYDQAKDQLILTSKRSGTESALQHDTKK